MYSSDRTSFIVAWLDSVLSHSFDTCAKRAFDFSIACKSFYSKSYHTNTRWNKWCWLIDCQSMFYIARWLALSPANVNLLSKRQITNLPTSSIEPTTSETGGKCSTDWMNQAHDKWCYLRAAISSIQNLY